MRFIALILILIPAVAQALETDNYLSWGIELRDSSGEINRFFREGIRNSLRKIDRHDEKSCAQMTELIGKDFASFLVHDNPVENWLFSVLSSDEMYPMGINYVEESIYRIPFRFYIPLFGLAPNIQVKDFYFGTDKLSHFASTGMIYYKIFRKELAAGSSGADAERKAIDWGIRDEKSVHGYWASGVFSYADLECNYQGLRFYRKFCESDSPYLQKKNHEWVLAVSPDIRDFVSAFWDETFEPSYLLPENWAKVAPILREYYCPRRTEPSVEGRFSYYQKSAGSFSRDYLRKLQENRIIPRPQSFAQLCSGL